MLESAELLSRKHSRRQGLNCKCLFRGDLGERQEEGGEWGAGREGQKCHKEWVLELIPLGRSGMIVQRVAKGAGAGLLIRRLSPPPTEGCWEGCQLRSTQAGRVHGQSPPG